MADDNDEYEEITMKLNLTILGGTCEAIKDHMPQTTCFAICARDQATGEVLKRLMEAVADGRIKPTIFLAED